MKSSINLGQIGTYISRFFHRFHVIVFVLTIAGSLSVATFMLNQTLSAETAPDSQSTATFDKDTMKRIEGLSKTTTETKPLDLPAGRVNPFVGS